MLWRWTERRKKKKIFGMKREIIRANQKRQLCEKVLVRVFVCVSTRSTLLCSVATICPA